jgi:bifunctional ADP-heptose synthase (sugar kinase/adenylyltransferase)
MSVILELEKYDLVVISDYNKGFLSEERISEICLRHPRVIIDTKKPISAFAEKALLVKINETEMELSGDLSPKLQAKTIVTLGPLGAVYQGQSFPVEEVREVYDTSGAGDAFLASLAVSILNGASVAEAIPVANRDAGSVVGKKGVTKIER